MPYKSNITLPSSVRNYLPELVQSIYREAFNHAWENYKNLEQRRGNTSREITAYRVACSAVEKKYIKSATGKWTEEVLLEKIH